MADLITDLTDDDVKTDWHRAEVGDGDDDASDTDDDAADTDDDASDSDDDASDA